MRDKRGVWRGACTRRTCPADCTEFDREDGKTSCGYCGCPPGEVTAPQETSDAPSAASTSSTSSAFHKISDKRKESFGWVKLAKAGKTKFGNSILPAFHEAYYPVSQNPVTFRRDFMVERDREFSVKEEVSKISRLIDFIRGDNSAAAGRFLSTSFRIKGEKDSTTIQNNTDKLKALQERLLQIEKELQTHDATLFKSGGRHVKQGRTTMHAFNTEQLDCISNLKATVKATLEKLEDALKRVKRIYKVERTTRQSRKKKQQRTKKKKKKQARKEKGVMEVLDVIAPNKGDPIMEEDINTEDVKKLDFHKAPYVLHILHEDSLTIGARVKIKDSPNDSCGKVVDRLIKERHASCRGDCEADFLCPVNWKCSSLLSQLGGETYKHMFAPGQTGLPQLSLKDMEKEVLRTCTDGDILQLLADHGCFEQRAEEKVNARLAELKGESVLEDVWESDQEWE